MSQHKINNKVITLKKDSTLKNGITLKAGTELEVVMDVVYMNGFPIQQSAQAAMLNWIIENPTLFKVETKW